MELLFDTFQSQRSELRIRRLAYRLDRSYAWNYSHGPTLPRRPSRLPPGPGAQLFDYRLNSPLGIGAGILLNSKWVDAYAHLGFDVLTYATVRSAARPAYPLPNITPAESRDEVVVARRTGEVTAPNLLALSTGSPSQEPDVWRKDVRRAKERIGSGQILVVSVIGTPAPDGEGDALATDYAQCATWATESGADAIEVHLAWPRPETADGRMVYDDLRLSAYILDRVRAAVRVPIVAKLGGFRSARVLHETLTKLAPWVHGFVLVHGIRRRLVDESGNPFFADKDRAVTRVIGPDTFTLCSRQVEEGIAWRKAGAWPRALLALGGIASVDQVRSTLRAGADVALVDTAALVDPLFAVRTRGSFATAA